MKHILVLGVSLVLISSCSDPIESVSPRRENIAESVYASGLLKSKNQYQVYSTVTGLLYKIYVEEGDTVKKGSPLFSIQNETSTLSRENAQLAAELAGEKLNQGKLDELELSISFTKSKMINDSLLYARQQYLWSQNIGSRIELEKAELSFQNSENAYAIVKQKYADEKKRLDILSRQAQKNVQITRKNESDFTVESAISGRIYSLLKEPGEMVTPQTPLALIGDANNFILELQVDEYDIVLIRPGQQVKVTMDSYKGQVFDAVITKIYPILNQRTKTATVEAAFIQVPPALYPNLTLEANILLQVKENVLTLPRNYVLDNKYVITSGGDTLEVSTGLKDYLKIEITGGLSEDAIVIRPQL